MSARRVLRAKKLTAEAFAPYGQVVGAGLVEAVDANQGTAARFNRVAELVNLRTEAKANVAVFRSTPVALPFRVKLLEKHPCSTQMFVPMACERYLVMVAPRVESAGVDAPDPARIEVFEARAGLGINYAPGVWHHPILALDRAADFLMVAWEDGSASDCVEHWFGDEAGEIVVDG